MSEAIHALLKLRAVIHIGWWRPLERDTVFKKRATTSNET